MTPQPIKPYFDRIDVRVPQGNGVPVTYVSCTPVQLHPIALAVERARRLPLENRKGRPSGRPFGVVRSPTY